MGSSSFRVLGIDPGLTRCGIGVVERISNLELHLVDVGVIYTDREAALELRLLQLESELTKWVTSTAPDAIAVERVFSQQNLSTVMGTGQAAGIALLVAAKSGIPVVMHTPSEVKASVTGSGRATKKQVAEMVGKVLHLESLPKPVDATDALALAICHIWRGSGNSRIERALSAEKVRLKKLAAR